MDLLFILLFWLSGQTGNPHVGADTGANAASQAGRTFGPVFDPRFSNCQTFEDGTPGDDGGWTYCVTFPKDDK